MSMMICEWTNLRVQLHHDWMQKYMTFLYAHQAVLDEMASGKTEWRADIKAELFEWVGKRELFLKLLDGCEEALSPQQYLDEPPLNSISEDTKKWLGEVVHALYLERTHIRETIASLKFLLEKIDEAFADIISGKSKAPSKIRHFIDRLREFSKAISRLPHNIQVV